MDARWEDARREPPLAKSIRAIFLMVGPPTFGMLFLLAVSIAAPVGDPLHTKIHLALGITFSGFGLLFSYAVGLVPSLIASSAYATTRRHIGGFGHRLLVAAPIGAAVYFVASFVVLDVIDDGKLFSGGGRTEHDLWLFTAYAAGAGAVSIVLSALIVEIWAESNATS